MKLIIPAILLANAANAANSNGYTNQITKYGTVTVKKNSTIIITTKDGDKYEINSDNLREFSRDRTGHTPNGKLDIYIERNDILIRDSRDIVIHTDIRELIECAMNAQVTDDPPRKS